MLPEFPKFKMLDVGDKAIFERFASRVPGGICEFSFANLIVWRDFDRPGFTSIDGNLCVRIDPMDEPPFFLEPLGEDKMGESLRVCMEHTGKVSRASADFALRLGSSAYSVKPVRDHFDYLYRVKDLAELKGRRYDGKRNHIRRLKRRYPAYEYSPLGKEAAGRALDLFEAWCRIKKMGEKEEQSELVYGCQRCALERTFEHYDELGLIGGELKVDGACAGFVVGSELKKNIACVHFCYANPEVPGSFQTTLWESCRNTFSGFEYVNLEQDLGIVGLRKLKEAYYPIRIEEKFEIERR